MESVHDMGGTLGYGSMPVERDDLPFHASWEPIGYLASSAAVMRGLFTADAIRYAIERIPARDYITMSYFERVITGMATLYVERGLIPREELEQRAGGHFPLSLPVPEQEIAASRDGHSFQVGEFVTVCCSPTTSHCRAPRYTWGKRGHVVGVSPLAAFPSEAARPDLTNASVERTYQVRFEGRDLWPEAEVGSSVVVDLFQNYLLPADAL